MDTENSVQEENKVGELEPQVEVGTEPEKEVEPVSGDKGKAQFEALLKRLEGIEKSNQVFQSEKDKAVKRANEAEAETKTIKKQLESLRKQYQDDPEFKSALDQSELESYRSRERINADQLRQQQEMAAWGESTRTLLDEVGVPYNHPELAYAARGAKNGYEAQRMIIAKAKEIKNRESGGTVNNNVLAKLKADILAELRKDAGLDTTESIPPAGTSGKVYTSQSVAQMSPEDYAKEEPEIMRAIAEGRFKK